MEDINKQVTLLAILKKEKDETLNDILVKLENSRVYSLKEGKQILKELKDEKLLKEGELTLLGIEKAKEAEKFFML
ncbi:MAG: hypothetical protein RBR07_09340 [Arcobacteraceae bacterium]|nr:hypothetical protein [Arcobacteraceae bacterium]